MKQEEILYQCSFQCSVSCGSGTQQRNVICRNTSGEPSSECFGAKPSEIKSCRRSCDLDDDQEITAVTDWEKMNETRVSEEKTAKPIHDEYDDETWEDKGEEKTSEVPEETTKTTKVSTNPK